MNVTSIPTQVHGEIRTYGDGRYRLWTVEHVAFDDVAPYSKGGPAKVVIDGWSTSTSSLSRIFSSASVVAADDGMHKVSATRDGHYEEVDGETRYVSTKHALHGQRFATQRDADRAVFNAGLTAFMVYEREAATHGFPVE